MNKLPTAAEVRRIAEELRLSAAHFEAVEYRDDYRDYLAASEMLAQFAVLLERERWPGKTMGRWHGPLASARGWTVPDQAGQFEIEVDVPCYVVEIKRSSKVVMS